MKPTYVRNSIHGECVYVSHPDGEHLHETCTLCEFERWITSGVLMGLFERLREKREETARIVAQGYEPVHRDDDPDGETACYNAMGPILDVLEELREDLLVIHDSLRGSVQSELISQALQIAHLGLNMLANLDASQADVTGRVE